MLSGLGELLGKSLFITKCQSVSLRTILDLFHLVPLSCTASSHMWGQIVLEQIVINRIEKCFWVHNVFIILRIWGHSLITLHVTNSWY